MRVALVSRIQARLALDRSFLTVIPCTLALLSSLQRLRCWPTRPFASPTISCNLHDYVQEIDVILIFKTLNDGFEIFIWKNSSDGGERRQCTSIEPILFISMKSIIRLIKCVKINHFSYHSIKSRVLGEIFVSSKESVAASPPIEE